MEHSVQKFAVTKFFLNKLVLVFNKAALNWSNVTLKTLNFTKKIAVRLTFQLIKKKNRKFQQKYHTAQLFYHR